MSYLSVPKFAEKVGVTKQAIYLRIKKADPEFLKFVIKEGNITKISEDAEILFNYRLYSDGEESKDKENQESNFLEGVTSRNRFGRLATGPFKKCGNKKHR